MLTLPPTSCHSPIRVLIMLRACSFDSSTAKSFVQHRAEYFEVIVNRVSSLWRRDFFDPEQCQSIAQHSSSFASFGEFLDLFLL